MTSMAGEEHPGEVAIRPTPPLSQGQLAELRRIVAGDAEASALFAELSMEVQPWLDATPAPLRVIDYEGLVNTDPRRIASAARLKEMDGVAAMLHYWQVTQSERAAEALRRFVSAWTATYEPTGNDVNESKLVPLLVAYEGLRGSFEPVERERIDGWLRQLGELHAKAVSESGHLTNRYAKRLRLLALFGRIVDRGDWREAAVTGLKRFVSESLRPDGTSLDLERRDSLTYHISALRPVIEIAMIAQPDGNDLYHWVSPTGSSLKKSVDYVVPYADGSKTREEWHNTTVELDRQRASAGLEYYRPGRLFRPSESLALIEEASAFDPGLVPVALKLHEKPARKFASWTMVVNAACASR